MGCGQGHVDTVFSRHVLVDRAGRPLKIDGFTVVDWAALRGVEVCPSVARREAYNSRFDVATNHQLLVNDFMNTKCRIYNQYEAEL